jgi:FtsZ-interacting cell division protein ZipA
MMKLLHELPLNELQFSLLGVGLLAVAVVWGYNLWQERKHRKLAQQVFCSEQNDVLMAVPPEVKAAQAVARRDEGAAFADFVESTARLHHPASEEQRIEPVIDPLLEDAASVPADPPEASASASEWSEQVSLSDGAPPPPADDLADEMIDCFARLHATELVSAPLFWVAQRQFFSLLTGRLRWYGFDEHNGQWRLLDAQVAESFRHILAALQVADRRGAIDADDLELFAKGVRQLAAQFGAQVELPALPDVLAYARALDEFCAAVDWRLAINLVHRNGLTLPLAGVRQLAEAAGLHITNDNVFVAEDGSGHTLFTLTNLGGSSFAADEQQSLTANGVTLTLDVPRVASGSEAFDRMLNLARHLVVALDAALVDDQRAEISDEMLVVIRAKIEEFQQKMAARDIPAGGRRALRLYA